MLTTAPRRPDVLTTWALATSRVTAMPAGYYIVEFAGPIQPRIHVVRKDKTCACSLGKDCPAVAAVTRYLRRGGGRAPEPDGRSLIPEQCPICGGPVKFEPRLCSPIWGAGWVCLHAAEAGGPGEAVDLPKHLRIPGRSHFWRYRWTTTLTALLEKQP